MLQFVKFVWRVTCIYKDVSLAQAQHLTWDKIRHLISFWHQVHDFFNFNGVSLTKYVRGIGNLCTIEFLSFIGYLFHFLL